MLQKQEQAAVAAATIASTSPLFGEYAYIVLAALFGGLVALSKEWQSTRLGSAAFLFRAVAISTALTSIAATYVASKTGYAVTELLVPVAFMIAMVGDGWFRVRDRLMGRIK